MSIKQGDKLTHAEAEKISGQSIIPRALHWAPQGSRILIVRDQVPEKVGNLFFTEKQRDMQTMGTGWVLSAGPEAGLMFNSSIGQIAVDEPKDLLGLHVLFGFHSGKVVRFSILDSEYESKYLLIPPLDIWMVDYNKDPLNYDAQWLETYAITQQGIEDKAAAKLTADRQALIKKLSPIHIKD